jgi:hypothetical protein
MWQGKQLVMKNPVNTARIDRLVKIFPDAKFIYLYRDPGQVFRSTCKLFDKFLALYSFQEIEPDEMKENIRWIYSKTIARYESQKHLIPSHNLVEIDYHSFIQNPLAELERIYRELHLDGFETAKNDFKQYIIQQSGYHPDPLSL